MRGAVSVALVYAYYDPNGTTTDRPRSTLISMTLTVVLISTLAFGAVTKPLLDILLGSKGGALSGGGGGDCCGSDGGAPRRGGGGGGGGPPLLRFGWNIWEEPVNERILPGCFARIPLASSLSAVTRFLLDSKRARCSLSDVEGLEGEGGGGGLISIGNKPNCLLPCWGVRSRSRGSDN